MTIWVNKYKPKNFNDFTYLNCSGKNIFKNTLIYGKAGMGKTTYLNIIINENYKKEDIKDMVLFLNASDERGIETVRNKIKNFGKKSLVKNYKYKLIILDEADNLTPEAQTALRRIIEDYNKNTIFYFICNYENLIIKEIKSRCNILRFDINKEYIKRFLFSILEKEIPDFSQEKKDKIINKVFTLCNNTDIRNCIHTLQNLIKKYDYNNEIFGIISYDKIHNLLMEKNIEIIKNYSLTNIIDILTNKITENNMLDENKKIDFIIFLSNFDANKTNAINYDIAFLKLSKEYKKMFI